MRPPSRPQRTWDGNVLLRFENGARGVLYASQISAGEENGLRIRVYGEKGGIEWVQTEPNRMEVKWTDRPMEVKKPGNGYLSACRNYRAGSCYNYDIGPQERIVHEHATYSPGHGG